jgi:hypothetical protein
MLTTSIEQAALNALAAWLRATLPTDVIVSDRWPDPDKALPQRAVTILRAGGPTETSTQPSVDAHEVIHDAVTPRVRLAEPVDVATSITVLNACRASYELHRLDVAVHATADTANAITAPVATNQTTAEALANNLATKGALHLPAGAHVNPDGSTTLVGLAPITPGNVAQLVAKTTAVLRALNAHYAARIYLWRVAEVEQPVQLDVWAVEDVGRDDVVARLEQVLHAGPGASAGELSDDPVSEYLELVVGDGWTDAKAEAIFDAPSYSDDSESKRRDEYRARYGGTLTVSRFIRSQSPRMTRAQLVAIVGLQPIGRGDHTSTATVTRSGSTTTTQIVP